MKKTKAFAIVISAVLIVTTTIVGVMAYLVDEATVVNTFTVGKVDITLDEAAVTPDGTPIEGADRVDGNEYHLMPGQEYVKDPTVTVKAGSAESYIRMLVTINEIETLTAALGDDFLPQDYVTGWDSDVWQCVSVSEVVNDAITYEFRYFEKVDAYEADEDIVLDALFDSFTLPGSFDGEELEAISDLEITVVGHAIQALGFDDADTAWAEFEAQVA